MKHQNVKNSTNGLLSLLINIFFCSSLFWALSPWLHSQEALPHFSSPAIITSAGQSAEVQLAAVIAKRAGLEATLIKMATPADLKGTKTLILVLGASLKGLGAAGLDMNQEIDRVKSLLQACQEKKIPIICLHLGGESRRGELSDKIINLFLPQANLALAVRSGNQDDLFTTICQKNNIPLILLERASEGVTYFKEIFQLK
ncbi:DUF6305 family protein [Candidatus Aminicenantes bacterium AC-334-K16]|jgi:hypothetical protein|nr:DUF6305 family protein [Candidatus Aminicenantes bacterium AC-334-K16]